MSSAKSLDDVVVESNRSVISLMNILKRRGPMKKKGANEKEGGQ